MGDLALEWQGGAADLVIVDDDLESDEGLRTAMLLSLFADRRAEDDDELPSADGDRRGWWGDEFAEVQGDRYGSRLWLLDRAKRTPDLARDVEEYAREALAWVIEDRVCERIDVSVEVHDHGYDLHITPHRPGRDPVSFRFAHVWEGEAARLAVANKPPVAAWSHDAADDPRIAFHDDSSDADGVIVSWAWDFGDGNESSEQHPVHEYAAPGEYTVTLTVTDSGGLTAQHAAEISVAGRALVAFTNKALSGSGTGAASFIIPSVSFAAGTVATIGVMSRSIAGGHAPTAVESAGRTWVKVNESWKGQAHCSVWRSYAADATSGVITLTYGATCDAVAWSVDEVANANTSGIHGSGATVQSATAGDASAITEVAVAFGDALENAANAALVYIAIAGSTGGVTGDSDFTPADADGEVSAGIAAGYAAHAIGQAENVTSWVNGRAAAAVLVEVRAGVAS